MIDVEKKQNTVVLTFGPDEHDMLTMAPVRITLSPGEAKDLAKKLRAATVPDAAKAAAAEKILSDNGVEPDEASTVLQAVGYALLDEELYPDVTRLEDDEDNLD
jgi:hypothetical protein